MNFKEYQQTNEVFDKPYKWEKVGAMDYEFKESKDSYYLFEVRLVKDIIRIEPGETTPGGLLIGWVISFMKNGDISQSKSESPLRVFATVVDIVKKELTNEIQFIEYSSNKREKTREKLYKKMTPYFMKKLGWTEYQQHDNGAETYFTIYRDDVLDKG